MTKRSREFEKLSGLKFNKLIGSGVYGKVYSIKEDPKLVVKVQGLWDHLQELPTSVYLSNKNVIPKVRNIYKGNKDGYIVQDRYDGTLYDIINKKTKNLPGVSKDGNLNKKGRRSLRNAIKKLHHSGVIHLNLHRDNIVYKKTPKGLKFKVIDLGHAYKTNKPLTSIRAIKKETEKRAKKMFSMPSDIKLSVEREVQFYKGNPPPKHDYTPTQRQLKLFKGI